MRSPTSPRNERPDDRDYVDSNGNDAADEEERVVPIPEGVSQPGTWQHALRQYLMTLNTPRTREGYEQGVRYFFSWPGVPECLADLTFELLNEYRWSLKQRCEPGYQPPAAPKPPPARAGLGASTALVPVVPAAFTTSHPQYTEEQRQAGQGDRWRGGSVASMGKLAPNTVISRLTGLKGFLIWCVKRHYVRQLTADEIREALKPPAAGVLQEHAVIWEWEWSEWLDCVGTPVLIDAVQDRRGYLVSGPRLRDQRATLRRATRASKTKKTRGELRPRCLLGKTTGERDVLIVRLLLITWVRNAELRSLNIGNLQCKRLPDGSEQWSLHLAATQTKGRHAPRDLPLPLDWVHDYSRYLASTGRRWTDTTLPLFVNAYTVDAEPQDRSAADGRISGPAFGALFLRANIEWQRRHPTDTREFSAHGMRRSGATAARNGNPAIDPPRPPMPIEMVSKMLGHAKIETTIRYLASGDVLQERAPYTLNPTRRPHPPHKDSGAV